MKPKIQGLALTALAAVTGAAGCGGESGGQGPLDEVDAIVFIERQSRMDGLGDIFQYQSYVPGARLLKLSPPTADGEVTELCCSGLGEYEAVDIIDFDLSFDARSIVFSGKLSDDQRYGLFLLDLESGDVEQLPTDPDADFVYPTFLPGDRILFATNAVVEEGAPQFADEYERGTTLQSGSISTDGSDLQLYSRNLSHRITTTVMHTGEVLMTQWDHLNELNAGHLVRMNPDGTRVREAFGKENTGITNSYYKAVEAAPGRVIAIGSSRDRTFQSGAILDIRLGEAYEVDGEVYADREMSEVTASTRILTNQVPLGDEPSFESIGRYYNAYPLNSKEFPDLLVSWADGPVQSDVNGAAGVAPDFGLYLFDSDRGTRQPIYDGAGTWEINPTPLRARPAPPTIPPSGSNSFSDDAVLLGAMNVYETSLGDFDGRSNLRRAHRRGLLRRGGRRQRLRPDRGRGRRHPGHRRGARRRLVGGADPAQHPGPPDRHRQVRHGRAQRVGLDHRPPRRVALLRRLPREPHRDHGDRAGPDRRDRAGPQRPDEPGGALRPHHHRRGQPGRHPVGHGAAAHLRRQVRHVRLPRRHARRGQQVVHHHRSRDRAVADLHLRPARRRRWTSSSARRCCPATAGRTCPCSAPACSSSRSSTWR